MASRRWTVLLALAPARYFPALWIKWAWLIFHIGLAAALLHLTYVWQPWLATLLLALLTGDGLLTTLQVLLYNLPGARSPLDLGLALLAVGGPSLSAFLLWRGRLHRQKK